MSIVNLGRIGLNVTSVPHIQADPYKRLDVVQDSISSVWYIAHSFDVPTNIPLTDTSYWSVFFDGVANNAQIQQNTTDIATLNTSKADVHDHPYVLNSALAFEPTGYSVPKRDGLGDIRARLFRPEYTGGSTNANYFCVQHAVGKTTDGADNYIRTRTKSQVKTDLGIRDYTYQKRGAFGDARTHYIYPPTGYDMSHLTSVGVWVTLLHMNSSTLDANLSVTYEATRIVITTHVYIKGVGYHTAWEKA